MIESPAHMQDLARCCDELAAARTGMSEFLSDVSGFMTQAIGEITHFRGIIAPYAAYFYGTDETASDAATFVDEVVDPSRSLMRDSVGSVAGIVAENDELGAALLRDFTELVDLSAMLDEIGSVYAQVAPLVERGDDGADGARWMGAIMRDFTGESAGFSEHLQGIMRHLAEALGSAGRDHRAALEAIEGRFGAACDDLLRGIGRASRRIARFMEQLDGVEAATRGIVIELQSEDIERQNIEKICYITEELIAVVEGRFDESTAALAFAGQAKLEQVKGRFETFHRQIADCLSRTAEAMRQFDRQCDGGVDESAEGGGLPDLGDDYERIGDMEEEYLELLDAIIDNKKMITALFGEVIVIKRRFARLFMMALDANAKLESWIRQGRGGDGDRVRELAGRGIGLLREYTGRFKDVNYSLGTSSTRFHFNLLTQERILQKNLFGVRKLMGTIRESLQYYRMITGEIASKTAAIAGFMADERDRASGLDAVAALVDRMLALYAIIFPAAAWEIDRSRTALEALKERYAGDAARGEYRAMMLISLLSEVESGEATDAEVVFF
ncbi:MAG TPA: hypothetical protein PLG31_04590 [Spirochaetota bacterium]|nr:hypothetical protein [Spirochaetota bacterium]